MLVLTCANPERPAAARLHDLLAATGRGPNPLGGIAVLFPTVTVSGHRRPVDGLLFTPQGVAVLAADEVIGQAGYLFAPVHGAWTVAGQMAHLAAGAGNPAPAADTAVRAVVATLRQGGIDPGQVRSLIAVGGDLTGIGRPDSERDRDLVVARLSAAELVPAARQATEPAEDALRQLWTTADVVAALRVLRVDVPMPGIEPFTDEGFPYSPYVLRPSSLEDAPVADDGLPPEDPAAGQSGPPQAAVPPAPQGTQPQVPPIADPTMPVGPPLISGGTGGAWGTGGTAGPAAGLPDGPGAVPPGAVPPGTVPPGTVPPGSIPPGAQYAGPPTAAIPVGGSPDSDTDSSGGLLLLGVPGTDAGGPSHGPFAPPEPDDSGKRRIAHRLRWPLVAAALVVVLVVAALGISGLFGTDDDPDASADTTQPGTPPATTTAVQTPGPQNLAGYTFHPQGQHATAGCAQHAYGTVQEFLSGTPCSRMNRGLFSTTVDGRLVVVTVADVAMPGPGAATEFKDLVDTSGTGNVNNLLMEGMGFEGAPAEIGEAAYASGLNDSVVRIVEAGWADSASLDPGGAMLETLVDTALDLTIPE